ncbi:50S ribosomal protein L23 [Pseudomonadota bacterium]
MNLGTVYDTIIRVINTEKSARDMTLGKYYFEVQPDATKGAISKAVEKIFGVKVKSVNILNIKGKVKRFRGRIGRRKNTKRAIVTLEEGQSINYSKVN